MLKQMESKFLLSAKSTVQFPPPLFFEIAFFGRSNVGKSSLLNVFTGTPKLARVSSTPGCTREINFFMVDNKYYIVDLPGYGYAKYSKDEQRQWAELIDEYMKMRAKSVFGIVIIDIRRGITDLDEILFEMLSERGIHFGVVATKIDKLKKNELRSATLELKASLESLGHKSEIVRFSAITGDGKKELYNLVTKKCEEYRERNARSVFVDGVER